MAPTHLHRDDVPGTLAILAALLGHRADRVEGYSPSPALRRGEAGGAVVDWQLLLHGPLSSSEVATVAIAQGVARAERSGGLPPAAADQVAAAVNRLRPTVTVEDLPAAATQLLAHALAHVLHVVDLGRLPSLPEALASALAMAAADATDLAEVERLAELAEDLGAIASSPRAAG